MSEKRLTRSTMGGAQQRDDFPELCRLYLDGKLKLDELITDRIQLHEINTALETMDGSKSIRTVITF